MLVWSCTFKYQYHAVVLCSYKLTTVYKPRHLIMTSDLVLTLWWPWCDRTTWMPLRSCCGWVWATSRSARFSTSRWMCVYRRRPTTPTTLSSHRSSASVTGATRSEVTARGHGEPADSCDLYPMSTSLWTEVALFGAKIGNCDTVSQDHGRWVALHWFVRYFMQRK